eukprot:gene9634-8579_t
MAFIKDDDGFDTGKRFSLLMLEPAEIYYEDFSVDLVARPIKGRLLVCSNSILFDPQDQTEPILKFPYRKCETIRRWEAPLMEGNVVKPYQFVKLGAVAQFRFCPNYNSITAVLSKCTRLLSAHKGRARNKSEIIAKITEEHQQTIEFDTGFLEDFSEKIYLQPFNNVESEPVQKFNLSQITRIIRRRYLLSQRGLEIFFGDDEERSKFYAALTAQAAVALKEEVKGNLMLKWQNGEISNYDYLMHLNNFADRSFNDLTQYPVFPWIIADYTSATLDLTSPDTFRDLSKPIGALTPKRLAGWKQRFEDMPEPKFLYGTHYSSPGYVLFYTVRVAPEYTLCLQAGKQNVLNGGADVKELIPEFYKGDGQRLSLGIRQETGERVGDVNLPPWAETGAEFVAKCREALECDYVSAHLHEWIDLIFGHKQLGADAIKADNVFYPLTYEGAVDLDKVTDPVELESLQAQITEFGQTPKQLFQIPHPPRSITLAAGGGAVAADDAGAGAAVGSSSSAYVDLRVRSTQKLHKDAISAVVVSKDGNTMHSVSHDGTLAIYSLEEGRQLQAGTVSDMAVSSVLPLEDGKTVMVGAWDNNVWDSSVKIWKYDEAASGSCRYADECLVAELEGLDGEVHCMAIHRGRRLIAAAGATDGMIVIWQMSDSNEVLTEIEAHDDQIFDLQFSPDGHRLVSSGNDGMLKVFDIDHGGEIVSGGLRERQDDYHWVRRSDNLPMGAWAGLKPK